MATVVVVAGTCGTGKSTIGKQLAVHYQTIFLEGDDLHPLQNIEKMSRGIPLSDDDRWGWLEKISKISTEKALESDTKLVVVSCSSLKKVYRETIQVHSPNTRFIYVFLFCTKQDVLARTAQRKHHFMKPVMVESQFADLQLPREEEEPNTGVLTVTNKSIEQVLNEAVEFIDSKVRI